MINGVVLIVGSSFLGAAMIIIVVDVFVHWRTIGLFLRHRLWDSSERELYYHDDGFFQPQIVIRLNTNFVLLIRYDEVMFGSKRILVMNGVYNKSTVYGPFGLPMSGDNFVFPFNIQPSVFVHRKINNLYRPMFEDAEAMNSL